MGGSILFMVGEISRIYPMVSISYVLVAIGGVVLFGEHITPFRAIGIALVCIGVTILWMG